MITAPKYLIASALITLNFANSPAHAGTATSAFEVSADVQATCLISSSPMSFGAYTGALATTSSTISVTCTNTTLYTIGLDRGVGVGCSETLRCMTQQSGAAQLKYSLYHDAGLTNVWTSTSTHSGTGSGSAQSITVYGRVSAGQYVTPDTYDDTVTATISF